MTRKQKRQRRQHAPRQTAAARDQVRAAKALAELERLGYQVQRLGAWQYYISKARA